mmetsp:Transcript_24831/g.28606  ORF Transcript_24831/g.28606 Transcript_24831/m.28606 type:complete len:343 (+) Transcript_24831:73-1101(+)
MNLHFIVAYKLSGKAVVTTWLLWGAHILVTPNALVFVRTGVNNVRMANSFFSRKKMFTRHDLDLQSKHHNMRRRSSLKALDTISLVGEKSVSVEPKILSESRSLLSSEESDIFSSTTPTIEELEETFSSIPISDLKSQLLNLIPSMQGTKDELNEVVALVNCIEREYSPVLTLNFFNLMMCGEWQLLFTTNQLGIPSRQLRFREQIQRLETGDTMGNLTNTVIFDYADDSGMSPQLTFDITGKFDVKCSYEMNQGISRYNITLNDHTLDLPGEKRPRDLNKMVQTLMRAMPSELFDPNNIAVDTTFCDSDLRIVRYTGDRYEGYRNLFIRRGQVMVDPKLFP